MIGGSVLSVLLVLFFSTTFEARNILLLKPFNEVLISNFGLKYKTFDGQRDNFFETAYLSFKERPLLGVGPGNFAYASNEYSIINRKSDSSHNLLLDILIENGIVGLVLFLIFLAMFFAGRDKGVYSLIAVVLLVNFMTDYTFRISAIMLLFFFLLGLSVRKKL